MSTRTPEEPASGGTDQPHRSIAVLHVDDDPAFTELTAAFLAKESGRIDVHSVTNVDDALAHLETQHVDCVVSDYDMPGTDGLAFLLRVRERWPDLPFVLFTGKGSEEIAAAAISTGVSDYLQKGGNDRYTLLATRIITHVEKYWLAQELATVRRRYALVGTVAADAFYEWDIRTDRVWRNDGYARVFGYDESEMDDTFEWWAARLHRDDYERVLYHLDATFRSGDERYEDTYRFRLGDGSYGHIAARAHVDYDDGEPTTMTGALTELTRYVEQERRLEHAHTRLEVALEGTGTGVWEWDMETDEVTWDSTTEQLFTSGSEPFGGTKTAYLERIHPDDVPSVEAAIHDAIVTDELYEVEHRLTPDADGTVRWVNGWGIVVRRDDVPVRMVGFVRDISERHEVQAELQRQNDRLREFTSVVSHDLRGPLAVAMGHLDLVEAADERSTEHLATVRQTHERMDVLLKDLLTLARQGVSIHDPAPVSVAAVATDAWSMVDAPDATLTIAVDAVVMADERRVGQVFENLFRNSVEHGSTGSRAKPDGGGSENVDDSTDTAPESTAQPTPLTVTVGRFSNESGDGLFVADDGPGIDPDDHDRVFEPGYTTSDGGTGFGLAIVHRIAEAHGWDVVVTETDTGGARFEFYGVEFVDGEDADTR